MISAMTARKRFLGTDDSCRVVCVYSAAITKTIGCQRYQEYDQRPIQRNGSKLSSISAPHFGTMAPPAIASAVLITGSAATYPG